MPDATIVKPHTTIDRFHYGPDTNGSDAFCALRVYGRDRFDIVVATELDTNPGMSVTNAAERLHAAVDRADDVRPAFILIEHYPRNRYGSRHPETFAQIMVRDDRARWHGLTRQEVEAMIGGPIE